jgi:hypothetical protein
LFFFHSFAVFSIIFIDLPIRSVDKPPLYVKRHSHLWAANLPFFIAALMSLQYNRFQ